jgi:hypothetical protein
MQTKTKSMINKTVIIYTIISLSVMHCLAGNTSKANKGVDTVKTKPSNNKEISKTNFSLEIHKDTAYYNGEPVLIYTALSAEKGNRNYKVTNLNNQILAYVSHYNYVNGKYLYQFNFPDTKQSLSGALYEGPTEVAELFSRYIVNGKWTKNAVQEIGNVNRMVTKNNVVFVTPVDASATNKSTNDFYNTYNKGGAEIAAKKKLDNQENHTTYLETRNQTAKIEYVKIKNVSNKDMLIKFKNNKVANAELTEIMVKANTTESIISTTNDEFILCNVNGKKISNYVLPANVTNLVITNDANKIVPGKKEITVAKK